MDAAALVALACDEAPWIRSRSVTFAGGTGYVDDDGEAGVVAAGYAVPASAHALMWARITPENVASDRAMTRALLRSQITVTRVEAGCYEASLGEREAGWLQTPDGAVEALLDALLGEVTA